MVIQLPTEFPCQVRAIYSWSGEEKRDLGFVEGDIIEVINTGDGNWWLGRLRRNKTIGVFPCNFVEFVEDKKPDSPTRKPTGAKAGGRRCSVVSPSPSQTQLNNYGDYDYDYNYDDEGGASRLDQYGRDREMYSDAGDQDRTDRYDGRYSRQQLGMMRQGSGSRSESGMRSRSPAGFAGDHTHQTEPRQYKSRQDILRDLSQELNQTAGNEGRQTQHSGRRESRQNSVISNTDSYVSTQDYPVEEDDDDYESYRTARNSMMDPARASIYQQQQQQQQYQNGHQQQRRPSVAVDHDTNMYYEARHRDYGTNHGPVDEDDAGDYYYNAPEGYYSNGYNDGGDGVDYGGRSDDESGYNSMPNTPPVPPVHSHAARRLDNDNGQATHESSPGAGAHAHARSLNRTPSPLRNAMEDVLESLENLNGSNSSLSNPSPQRYNSQQHHPRGQVQERKSGGGLYRHSSDRTHMQMNHRSSSSNGSYFEYKRHAGGSSLDFRTDATTAMYHHQQHKSYMNDQAGTGGEKRGAQFGRSRSAFVPKDRTLDRPESVDVDSEEEEGYIPFDPSSYDHLATGSKLDPQVERADTYRSMSSVNTNSLSIVSTSTTPTSVSSHSQTPKAGCKSKSSGSQMQIHHQAAPPPFVSQRQSTDMSLTSIASMTLTGSTLSSPIVKGGSKSAGRLGTRSASGPERESSIVSATSAGSETNETPVVLPNAKIETKPKTSRSLKLRKSTGFIRKLFTSPSQTFNQSAFNWTKENQSQSTLEPETTTTATATTTSTLKRTKSRGSRMSMSSTSSRFRTSVKNSLSRISTSSSFSSKRQSQNSSVSWMEIRRDLHRANTISHNEREQRIRRSEVNGVPVTWPFHALVRTESQVVKPNELKRSINGSSSQQATGYTLRQSLLMSSRFLSRASLSSLTSAEKVDAYISNMNHWPQIMTPAMLATSRIAREFTQDRDRLRAVFMFCASKIVWRPENGMIGDEDDDEEEEEQDTNKDDNDEGLKTAAEFESSDADRQYVVNVLPTRQATTKELVRCVRTMCVALDIGCRIVPGHLKNPQEPHLRSNHLWNSVYVDGEWQLMDVVLANKSFHNYEMYYAANQDGGKLKGLLGSLGSGNGSASANGNSSTGTGGGGPLENGLGRTGSTSLPVPGGSSSGSAGGGLGGSAGSINDFYFLTAPDKFIFTHVPTDPRDQLLVPALSDGDAMGLPIATPEAFQYDIKFVDYYSCATNLVDLELAHICFQVGADLDVAAEVVVEQGPDFETLCVPGLAQAFWENNQRYFRVKAFVPDPYRRGILNIYVGSRGSSMTDNLSDTKAMSKAYVLSIEHQSNNEPFEFVMRHPTPHSKRQDIYVKQPQCKRLIEGSTFVFSVDQHPCGTGFTPTKLAIQSPSGKIIKLQKVDYECTYGTWESTIRCSEVGTWRGLVLADTGSAWSVFAEWYCV